MYINSSTEKENDFKALEKCDVDKTEVIIKPQKKQEQLIRLDLCIFLSTIEPPNAADIPRKNIASEKAN